MYEHVMVRWLEAIALNTERIAKAIEDINEAPETQLTASDVQQIIKHERYHEEAKLKYPPVSKEPTTLDELREIQDVIDELKQSLIDEDLSNG